MEHLRSVDPVIEQSHISPPFRSIIRRGAKSDFGGEIYRWRCQVSLPLSALP
ncbi:hypothetical protein BHM03_00009816 [Ensete ventricosum]|nr:hypothetical protein BHM03_00009816 [Ensete ventricosum]